MMMYIIKLIAYLLSLFENNKRAIIPSHSEYSHFSDVHFEVEGLVFACHRVFMQRCDYFRALLDGFFKEASRVCNYICMLVRACACICGRYG